MRKATKRIGILVFRQLHNDYGAGTAQAMGDFESLRAMVPEPASAMVSILLLLLPLRHRYV
jgi:hypothetical protein